MRSNNTNLKNISELREQISIVDVIGSFINVTRKGNNYLAICPFHNDSHASLSINEKKKIFKCFSCNESGDVFGFIKKYKKINYYQAVEQACSIAGIDYKNIKFLENYIATNKKISYIFEINSLAAKYFNLFLSNKENKDKKDYLLNKRKLDAEIIKKYQIGYAPKDANIVIELLSNKDGNVEGQNSYNYDELQKSGIAKINNDGKYECYFYDRIMFPIHNEDDEIVGFSGRTIDSDDVKYLNTTTTEVFNKSKILFNLNNVVKNPEESEMLYILEGFMDVISLNKINCYNAVATMGVAFSNNHLETLSKFKFIKSVIICYDNDEAGKKSIEKAAEILKTKYDVYVVKYISEHKDIDEIVNDDLELAKKTINSIIHYDTYKINQIIDTFNGNIAQKQIIIDKVVEILKTIKNEFIRFENIKNICEKLGVDEQIILKMIGNSKTNKPINNKINSNRYEVKNIVLQNNNIKKKPLENDPFIISEKEILKFSLLNKEWLNKFIELDGNLNNPMIKKIIDKLEEYYLNTNKESVSLLDITEVTKDEQEIFLLTDLMKNMYNQKTNFFNEKVDQIINSHKKLILKQKKMIIHQKYKNKEITDEEYVEILKNINKNN